jgi:hypothetical protein
MDVLAFLLWEKFKNFSINGWILYLKSQVLKRVFFPGWLAHTLEQCTKKALNTAWMVEGTVGEKPWKMHF